MDSITIANREVGHGEPAFVIAEAGSNHNGELGIAKELVDVAAAAGADAVKFQTFRAENMYVENSGEVDYLDDDRGIYEIVESMEMPFSWIPELAEYCRKQDIYFLSTPFDEQSAAELEPHMPAWKVASYTSSHHEFLKTLAATDKPIIMSTGAHEFSEVEESVKVLRDAGVSDLVVLQCVASYPTPLRDINVRVIETLQQELDVLSGLSDHTMDPTIAPAAATAVGAAVIEKHFTLDNSMEGPDHQFALEPDELDWMVSAIRDTEAALGASEKRVLDAERELYDKARRSIQAVEDIQAGDTLTAEKIKILRPGSNEAGIHPKFYQEIVGETTSTDIPKGAGVTWDHLDNQES